MSTKSIWGRKDKSNLIDATFFKWGQLELIYIKLLKPVRDYLVFEFDSSYGKFPYLKVLISDKEEGKFELKFLKVSSVRISSALETISDKITESGKSFPYVISLIKMGSAYQTKYYCSMSVSQKMAKNEEVQAEIEDFTDENDEAIIEEIEKSLSESDNKENVVYSTIKESIDNDIANQMKESVEKITKKKNSKKKSEV